jgi:hypothetical protein
VRGVNTLVDRRAVLLGATALSLALSARGNPLHRGGGGGGGPISRIIGALTPDGMGDIPITGSSIVSGNGAGHFKVAGGAIVANSTGTTAGFNAGPYTLTTNDGQVFAITMVANAYSIGKQDDFFTGSPYLGVGQLQYHSVALNGKRVIGRPGLACLSGIDGGFASPLRNTNFGDVGTGWIGVSLESEDYSNPWTWTDTIVDITARYVQFKGIQFTVPPTGDNGANAVVLDGSAPFPVSDIVFDSCTWLGATKDPNSSVYAAGGSAAYGNGRGISDNGDVWTSNIRIIGSRFMYCYRGAVLSARLAVDGTAGNLVSQPLHIAGNYFEYPYECSFQISKVFNQNAVPTVEDNVCSGIVGVSTDLGNPHPDAFYFVAPTATNSTDWDINCWRNWILPNGRGAAAFSFRDMNSGFYFRVSLIGNVDLRGSSEGLFIIDAKDCRALYNISISQETNDSSTTGFLSIGTSTTSGTHVVTGNVCEVLNVGGSPTLSGNVQLGVDEVPLSFATVFVGPKPTTRAAALTALVTKGIYAAAGPLGTANPVNYPAANPSNVLGSNNVS